MRIEQQEKLERWGLSPAEARIYLALLRNGRALGASAIAAAVEMPRPSVYPVLKTLVDKGMVENGEGYGSRFTAVSPDEALPLLVRREKEQLSQRERLTGELVKELGSFRDPAAKHIETEMIQVLRDPRVCAERIAKLQRGAEREIDALVKSPIITNIRDNPEETATLRRGLRVRAIYEPDVLDDDKIAPYLRSWIDAGEEARVYEGDLPLKLVLFDSRIAWMPLDVTGSPRAVTVLVQHHALAHALHVLFERLWHESKPLMLGRKAASPPAKR